MAGAAVDMMAGLLPMIKCSNCYADVGISEMGDHVCGAHEPQLTPPPEPPEKDYVKNNTWNTPSTGFNRDGQFAKHGRLGAPPRIDPLAANRPFLRPNLLTPATSDGAISVAPSPIPKSPLRLLKKSHTEPALQPQQSPEATNLDCAFLPFPRSNTMEEMGSRSRSRTVTRNDAARSNSRSPSSAIIHRFDDDTLPDPQIILPSPEASSQQAEIKERRKSNRHKREASVDSKGIYRLSVASSRYGGLTPGPSPGDGINSLSPSAISPGMISHGYDGIVDEVPPLPTDAVNRSTPDVFDVPPSPYYADHSQQNFDNAPKASPVSPKKSRRTGFYGSIDLGLPPSPDPEIPRDLDGLHGRFDQERPGAPETRYPEPKRDPSPGVPSYRVDEDFSVSNFARNLGLGDPYHNANDSTSSSGSTPSEAASGSSFSSHTSGAPSYDQYSDSHQFKQPPLDLEPVRPFYRDLQELDSPTDPAFQQGRLSQPSKYSGRFDENISQPTSSSLPDHPKPRQKPTRTLAASNKGRCRGCQLPITGKSVSSADGRLTGRYHKACFVCHTCQSPFQTADFYVWENHPYCAQHYHELNGSLCAVCNLGIEGQYLETDGPGRDGSGACPKFHPDCLKCYTCRIVLQGDYFEWNGYAYCERDARRAAAAMPPPPSPSMTPPHYGRRPSYAPSPLSAQGYPAPGSGLPPGPRSRYPPPPGSNPRLGPPYMSSGGSGARRFPERRTTRLMMA
ncbi:hypothetical protein AJ80_00632 [Polytolypa hystricis UAMH7299]|uniref:LIM zinc-binding domain-containing protein n=1 Tax=Polytolypa hystricis (strain UAMH7299) TaxID=1447883 RepID=A0A2B7Z2Z9_POLH7|nr:hypothetical protein AJ80_00632 [Polytolypa hystricis UAMH7299]